VPVLPALGNHDRGNTSNWRRFFALPNNERWYSFRCGSSAFHAVSSYDGRTPGSVQYNWLLNELLADSAAGMRHIFVWMHDIVWSTSQGAPDNVAKTYLCPLFERFGVEIVFCGHVHAYEHSLVNGVHYITTGGGGDSAVLPPDGWDAWQPWTVYREGTWECVRVDVEDDMVRSVGIRPDGSQFDTLCLYGGGISEPRQPLSAPGLRSAGAVQVYDATGRLVRGAPPPGVYFRRTGLRTTRELIRSKDLW